MHVRLVLLPFLCFFCLFLGACKTNPDYTVKGVVVDATTKNPIPGAIVSDGKYAPDLAAGDITDAEGLFSYNTYPEEHTIGNLY